MKAILQNDGEIMSQICIGRENIQTGVEICGTF